MKITKEMLKKVELMNHKDEIKQHYNLFKHYKGKDNTKSEEHKNLFLILGQFKTTEKLEHWNNFNEVQQMEQIKVINETTFRIENNEVVPYLRIAYFNYQLGY